MMRGVEPEIVLLHGFTNTGASWQPVISALGERYRAHAPDIRGHGTAAELEPVTLDAVIADIDALASGPFTLVGYSMGGRIALHAALALPSRVQRLILIGASPGISDPVLRAERRAADERLADEIERQPIESFARRWAQTPVLADQPAAVAVAVHEDRLRNTPVGLARALRGLGTGALPSLWERLGELEVPVTLLTGQRDAKFRTVAAEMSERLTACRSVVIQDAGHAVHIERPDEVAVTLQRID